MRPVWHGRTGINNSINSHTPKQSFQLGPMNWYRIRRTRPDRCCGSFCTTRRMSAKRRSGCEMFEWPHELGRYSIFAQDQTTRKARDSRFTHHNHPHRKCSQLLHIIQDKAAPFAVTKINQRMSLPEGSHISRRAARALVHEGQPMRSRVPSEAHTSPIRPDGASPRRTTTSR
jgi:hypothetical protein